jgi:hypothetical protein
LIARFLMGPANHILRAQTALLKVTDRIPSDPPVTLKITWLVRQILLKRMLEVLDTIGWQPDIQYKSKEEEDCVQWVISKESKWGKKYTMGIRGITQIAFQEYARRMAKDNLFAVLRDGDTRRIDGKGVIRDRNHLDAFIADDYGLIPRNNLGQYISRVIKGDEAIGHPYTLAAWRRSQTKPATKKRKTPSADEEGGEAMTSEVAAEGDPMQGGGADNPVPAVGRTSETIPLLSVAGTDQAQAGKLRRSGRASAYTGGYTEPKEVQETETDVISTPVKHKRNCVNCNGITDAVKELTTRSEGLTPFQIVKDLETIFDEYLPDLGKCLLLATDEDPDLHKEIVDPEHIDTDVDPDDMDAKE